MAKRLGGPERAELGVIDDSFLRFTRLGGGDFPRIFVSFHAVLIEIGCFLVIHSWC